MSRLPIPDTPAADRDAMGVLALAITEQARARYALHRQTHHRILTDLVKPGAVLEQEAHRLVGARLRRLHGRGAQGVQAEDSVAPSATTGRIG